MNGHTHGRLTAPLSRLITEEVEGELLIYDMDRKLAHCLNPEAAVVWKASLGATSIAEVAARVNAPGEVMDVETVRAAVETLRRKHLLEGAVTGEDAVPSLSRRDLIRRAGALSMAAAVPTVASLVVPQASFAASPGCLPKGTACSATAQCCAGLHCTGTGNFTCQ